VIASAHADPPRRVSSMRVAWFASIVFCAVLPAVTVITLFASTIADDNVAFDFRPFYRAAGAILDGRSPYPAEDDPLTAESGAYVYPPLPGLIAVPLRALPLTAAGLVVMLLLTGAVLATLRALDVRDWRCYGVVFLWPPVLSAIQTGNVTLLLGLCAALVWRFRESVAPPAALVGVTLAAKFFLWPLVAWLAATRRVAAAAIAVAIGLVLLVVTWAAIGFAGLADYPELMRRLQDSIGEDSYTLHVVALDSGLSDGVARAVWLAGGLALLTAMVVVGRGGDERRAFVLALGAALALTPIVWLHYFALLVVVVAVMRPRFGILWLVPLAMVLTPGSGHPTPFETAWTLGITALIIGLALRQPISEAATRAEVRSA
jgi:Glycosyltransferase family 87